MRKRVWVWMILLIYVLTGCKSVSQTYPFLHSSEDVVSIELLHNRNEDGIGIDAKNIYLIAELDKTKFSEFMDEIYSLETDRRSPPFWGYGEYIAKVTYSNGDVEMLGSLHIEFIPKEGVELLGYGRYFFKNGDEFIQLLEKYCDLPKEG